MNYDDHYIQIIPVDLSELNWVDLSGAAPGPNSVLLCSVSFGGSYFHLEAIQIKPITPEDRRNPDYTPVAVDENYQNRLDEFVTMLEATRFQLNSFFSRNYFVFMTPAPA